MRVPEPEDVLQDLSPLLPEVYSALEYGTYKAREYFENEGKTVDRYFAPHFVRYWAKQELEKAGKDVKEENDDFSLEHVANNGLYLVYAPYQIRILKSVEGGLPVPGSSKKKQGFYKQQTSFGFPSDGGDPSPTNLNLIILWDATDDYNLSSNLSLACPEDGGETRASVKAHWIHPIPHPVLSIAPTDEIQDEMEKTGDLPISPIRPADTGTGDAG